MKIPGIMVILPPFILYFTYIGVTSWYEWVNYDDVNTYGFVTQSCKDKLERSIIFFIILYGLSVIIVDSILDRPFMSLRFFWIIKLGSKLFNILGIIAASILYVIVSFVAFCNKHLTINFNKNEE